MKKNISASQTIAHLGHTVLGIIVTIQMLWVIPWLIDLVGITPSSNNNIFYSSVLDDFIISRYNEKTTTHDYWDTHGNTYTVAERDSLLPLLYYRQLFSEGRMPSTLKGLEITMRKAQDGMFSFRSTPSEVNTPMLPLYFLLESMSGRVELTMPDDVMRFYPDHVEFININQNTINERKSELFTWLMVKKGFQFPAQQIAGNPTARKDYDLGYLVTDNTGELFNLRMTSGHPYLRHIEKPQGIEIAHLFVTEYRNREWLGFVFDVNGQMWVIDADTYAFSRVDLPPIDLKRERIMMTGNMLDWTVTVTSETEEHYYAIDAQTYQLLAEYTDPQEPSTWLERIFEAMPKLRFLSPYTKEVYPQFY